MGGKIGSATPDRLSHTGQRIPSVPQRCRGDCSFKARKSCPASPLPSIFRPTFE